VPSDKRLVDMYCDLNGEFQTLRSTVVSLESEIEFSIKYIKAFWLGDDAVRDVIIQRLEKALKHSPRHASESLHDFRR